MSALGGKLVTSAQAARREVTLIAPFMKVSALTAILKDVCAETAVNVITRWIPVEIAVGVCDLEIFDVVAARPKAALYIHPLLHAKFYRFDDIVFFGSANLTAKALGWTAPANIEVLLAPKDMLGELKTFEADLLRSAIRVDAEYREIIRALVEKIKSAPIMAVDVLETETHGVEPTWLPTCRTPERLWSVYLEGEAARHRMVESAFEAALADLAVLDIMPGLPQARFNEHVAATLGQLPFVREIDVAARYGMTEVTASALIEGMARGEPLPYAAAEMWEVLQAWLLHFFPSRYRREATIEIFRQGRVIG